MILYTNKQGDSIPAHLPAIRVAFQTSSYTFTEDSGSVEVCAVIVGGGIDTEKPANVEVDLSLTAASAHPGS